MTAVLTLSACYNVSVVSTHISQWMMLTILSELISDELRPPTVLVFVMIGSTQCSVAQIETYVASMEPMEC